MIYALDIETIPNLDMVSRLPETEVAIGNLVDPAKIKAKQEAAKASQIDKMAIDPLYGRVCCVALVESAEGGSVIMPDTLDDAGERAIIQRCMEAFADPEFRLVTWNGNGFDLPFIYRRAVVLGVSPKHFGAPPLATWVKRYGNDRHIDLMHEWSCGGDKFTKLESVASAILGEHKTDIDVNTFKDLMQTEEGREQIGSYCLQDTRLTFKLYERALGVLFA